MPAVKSMSSPVSALEAAEAAPARKTSAGSAGTRPDGVSRSAQHLLGRGKSPAPIRRVPASSLETVIGADERTRILDTELNPWRRIAALQIKAPSGTFIGTGWFVGPRTLITAGHCVFDASQLGGWAKSVEVSPARNGQTFPFDRVVAKRFSSIDRWVQSQDPDFDMGAIHLAKPVGDDVGWFAVGSLPTTDLETHLVNISGYPALPGNGEEQWFHKNRILRVTERRLFYDVDTYGGQSGAPVFIYEQGQAEPLVVGIHAYGVGGTPSSFSLVANSAPRIIPEVYDQIQAWVAADAAGG
jgi:V8-like Glu-specific endopeptidase